MEFSAAVCSRFPRQAGSAQSIDIAEHRESYEGCFQYRRCQRTGSATNSATAAIAAKGEGINARLLKSELLIC